MEQDIAAIRLIEWAVRETLPLPPPVVLTSVVVFSTKSRTKTS